MKRFLVVALVVLVAAVFIHDVGYYVRARYDLSEATTQVTDQLSEYALGKTRDVAAVKAVELAALKKIEVWQYDQNDQGVQVWTRVSVPGTWVIGPFQAWRAGKPLETPLVLTDYGAAVYR